MFLSFQFVFVVVVLQVFARSPEIVLNELTWQADRPVSLESWIDQADYLSFNVSYQLLAGVLPTQQSESPHFVLIIIIRLLLPFQTVKKKKLQKVTYRNNDSTFQCCSLTYGNYGMRFFTVTCIFLFV